MLLLVFRLIFNVKCTFIDAYDFILFLFFFGLKSIFLHEKSGHTKYPLNLFFRHSFTFVFDKQRIFPFRRINEFLVVFNGLRSKIHFSFKVTS